MAGINKKKKNNEIVRKRVGKVKVDAKTKKLLRLKSKGVDIEKYVEAHTKHRNKDPNRIKINPDTKESTCVEHLEKIDSDDETLKRTKQYDEFSYLFNGEAESKILFTSVDKRLYPHSELFLKELTTVIPNCYFKPRESLSLSYLVEFANKRNFNYLVLLEQRHKKPHALVISHLPNGPTAKFGLSGIQLAQDIPGSVTMTDHNPELVFQNFDTIISKRLSRLLRCMFPLNAEYTGRRVITFHNQRDYIYFRHYRYIFKNEGTGADLAEIGPRFTLKLRELSKGALDNPLSEPEFAITTEMHAKSKDFYL